MTLYRHVPHPHIARRREQGPVRVAAQAPDGSAFTRFNSRLGLKITTVVGTMVCAYVFALWALYGLPAAIKAGPSGLVLWGSSEFAQLVLLPIIIVGQNIQARASDKRAEQTYNDAEAVLHEALEIQAHLAAQDAAIEAITELTKAAHQLVSQQVLREQENKPDAPAGRKNPWS